MMSKWEVQQKVGSGNFSTVHLVRNGESGQVGAIKIMKTHQNIALKEAYFLKNFDHPNIVRLFDFEQDQTRGETKMVLEYLPENTLELYEDQQYGLREEQVKCILFQAALGLAYIHERGIIHRDIKPENILIDKRKAEIKLIDFGLAISVDKISTDYVATRWYRAPENLLGTKEYSSVIDVFSLACVVVELYLGNPLFPGTDNIDQLYRIFNILGEPTETSWPNGFRSFKEMGFKLDSQRSEQTRRGRNGQSFGLRSLLKACSEGLVSLLERMLVLNPKKRISSRDIVLDSYFNDVKTIIPPHIYKRFEKDHLLKKTTSREVIENAEHFINIARSKLSKHHPDSRAEPLQKDDNMNSLVIPSKTETGNSNCALINFSISPRRAPAQEERDTSRHPTPQLQSSIKLDNNRQSETSSIRDTPSNGLSFRGFNPIKTNKVSVKDNRKHQESNSKEKYSHKDSRNNSIDSVRMKGKNISNSIDLGKKILCNNIAEPTFLIQRRVTNGDGRQYRTPQVKHPKSIEKNQVLYYFQGENARNAKYITPIKTQPPNIITTTIRQPINQTSIRLENRQAKNNSFLTNNDSVRLTRNNSAINPPTNRILITEIKPNIQQRDRERISHSPTGISLTQIQSMRHPQNKNNDRSIELAKESIYTQHPNNNRVIEKLKMITTQVGTQKARNDRSFQQQNMLDLSNNDIKSKNSSILNHGERNLEFKDKINLMPMPKQSSVVTLQPLITNRVHHHLDPMPMEKKMMSPDSKLKNFKSLQHRQITQISKFFNNPPQHMHREVHEMRPTMMMHDKRDYRQPRIAAKKIGSNEGKMIDNLSQLLHAPARQNDRNININLNVSIIESENKSELNLGRERRNRF